MSNVSATAPPENEEVWRTIFVDGHPQLKSFQRTHSWLPSPPRCKMCFAPFKGVGGVYMRLRGKGPANRNPQYCSACDKFLRAFPGGAEVELSMMFVDVRGSTPTGKQMKPTELRDYLTGFYLSATQALIDTDGFVIEFRGDCVVGVYPPGFSGPNHVSKVVEAARHLLQDIAPKTPKNEPIPIGIGVHTGKVFIGTVSGAEGGIQDLTILGDNANIAAGLSQIAWAGEALISDAVCKEIGLPIVSLEARAKLKGKSEPALGHIITAESG